MSQIEGFKSRTKYLSYSNFLQFLLVLVVIQFTAYLRNTVILYLYYGLAIVILGIDLFLTLKFLSGLGGIFGWDSPLAMRIYAGLSALTRIVVVAQFEVDGIRTLMYYLIPLTGVVFGWLLLSVTRNATFDHKEKLRLIAYANIVCFTAIFGTIFQEITIGIKILLPLPAAVVYLLISVDFNAAIGSADPDSKSNGLSPNPSEEVQTIFGVSEDRIE